MATLQQIGMNGLVGVAPTPVLQRAINYYLVNDELMNVMRFVNNAQGSNLGNFQVSYVYYEGTSEATFRALGVDYDPDNEQPLTNTVSLAFLGGAFETDIEIARAFGQNAGAVANWTEQQIAQKLNAITNGFAKAFIVGDKDTDSKSFNGLNKSISAGQVIDTPITVEYTEAGALKAEVEINKAIGKIKPKRPNLVITNATGKAILSSLNAYRHRGVEVIEVNGKKYDQYMGIPIVALTDNCFADADVADGKIPVIFGFVDELDGIRCSIPADGQVVIILPPKFENGKVIEKGACEMAVAPLFANPFAVAKCYLKEAVAE